MPDVPSTRIRLATSTDSDGIVTLIDGVLREYGDRICTAPGGAEADLLDIDAGYRAQGGEFWVLEAVDGDGGSQIVGTHATRPDAQKPGAVCTFKRLYLRRDLRGTRFGHDLMQVAIDWAKENEFERIEFWSDTRFERAHSFFKKFGFRHNGEQRHMTDAVMPYSEYFFYLDL